MRKRERERVSVKKERGEKARERKRGEIVEKARER